MPRRRAETPPPPAPPAGVLLTLDPLSVLDADAVRRVLRLRTSSLRREIREGRLRVSKRCGRYYFLGRWLIDWLEAGELRNASGVSRQSRQLPLTDQQHVAAADALGPKGGG
jgi:hypothetical protein